MYTNFKLQNFFQDSELQIEFNSKLEPSEFNSFVKMFKVFRLRTNANQNLILSALVEKSLKSENKDSVFLFCKTYEAVNLGISRSTLERFFVKLTELGIIVKVASREIETEGTINAYAFNIDKLQDFMASELKFNAYYKSIFGDNENPEKSNIKDDEVKRMRIEILALRDEVKFRDEKIDELKKNNTPKLEKGQGIYVVAEVEELQRNFEKTREKLAESNSLLESTATRLTKENDDLQNKLEEALSRIAELESQKGGPSGDKDEKIKELESKLEVAREFFKEQKREIETLKKSSGANIDEIKANIEADIKAKFNARIEVQNKKVNEIVAKKETRIKELELDKENFIKEVVALKEVEVNQLKEKVANLESELSKTKSPYFTYIDLVVIEKQLQTKFNPTQLQEIMEVLRNPEQPTCEGEAEKAEKEVYIPEITNKGDAPVFQQDDLPF